MRAFFRRITAYIQPLRERRTDRIKQNGDKWRDRSDRQTIVLVLLRCVLALTAVLICAIAELKPYIEILICIAGAFIIGYNAVAGAWEGILAKDYFNRYSVIVLVEVIAFSISAPMQAVLTILLYTVWDLLCKYIENDGKRTIRSGIYDAPKTATVLLGGIPHSVAADTIKPGTILQLNAGERAVSDCVVLSGDALILPYGVMNASDAVKVERGCNIAGGSLLLNNSLKVQAMNTVSESMHTLIAKTLEKNAEEKTGYEKRLAASAKAFALLGVFLSLLIGILVPLIFRASFAECLKRAGVILLVTCPYVFLAALPYVLFAGHAGIAKRGALVTTPEKLSSLASVTTVAADLHSAFSAGDFRIEEVNAITQDIPSLLSLAAAAAYGSDIPQLRKICEGVDVDVNQVIKRKYFPEIGVSAEFSGNNFVSVGFCGLMQELGVQENEIHDDDLTVYVAVNDRLAGIIRFAVSPRDDAPEIFAHLKHIGINRTVLLTDESPDEAKQSAEKIGAHEFYSSCTPGKKAERIRGLQAMQLPGERLAYLGTGFGDKTIMQEADISFKPYNFKCGASGADILLLNNKPETPGNAIAAAYDTVSTLRRHYLAVLILKILLVIFATCGWISFWIPPIADMLLHFAALMGAMRVYDPVHFDPNLKRRALRTTRKLFDFSGSMLQRADADAIDDPDELRRQRAERKALLFRTRKK